MYLVDEQDGPPLGEDAAGVGLATVEHLAHVLDARGDRTQGVEGHLGVLGDDAGQGGLAHSRRPPQDKRRDVAALDHAANHRALAHQVALADVVIEGAGPQPFGKRFVGHESSFKFLVLSF